jgi:release factor glutamine methyltransferase
LIDVTYLEHALAARARLESAGISTSTARLDADLLARHVLGWDQARWLADRVEPASDSFAERYRALVDRRAAREPAAQIRGVQEFWGREFIVSPAVLTPRPDTETLVEAALQLLRERPRARVLDIGTGSGCIGITLGLEHPGITLYATDISGDAIAVARRNAERWGVQVEFRVGPYAAGVPPPVDLIVSNPPYVVAAAATALAPEVRNFEPAIALYGGIDGLRDIRELLQVARETLAADGHLVCEIGYDQAESVAEAVAHTAGLMLVGLRHDLQGIPRVVIVKRA